MIHKTIDSLIIHLGGISEFRAELEKEGIFISWSSIKKWYTSNRVNPSENYHDAIKKIAKRNGREVKF